MPCHTIKSNFYCGKGFLARCKDVKLLRFVYLAKLVAVKAPNKRPSFVLEKYLFNVHFEP